MTKSILRNSEDLQLLDRSLDRLLDAEGYFPRHITSDNKFHQILDNLEDHIEDIKKLIEKVKEELKEKNGK